MTCRLLAAGQGAKQAAIASFPFGPALALPKRQ